MFQEKLKTNKEGRRSVEEKGRREGGREGGREGRIGEGTEEWRKTVKSGNLQRKGFTDLEK